MLRPLARIHIYGILELSFFSLKRLYVRFTMVIRHRPCMLSIHRPFACGVQSPGKLSRRSTVQVSGHNNAIGGEQASQWHNPSSSAYKRAPGGALIHHPATRLAHSPALASICPCIPYTPIRTSQARPSLQDEVSSS
jgi:hypothetical protein